MSSNDTSTRYAPAVSTTRVLRANAMYDPSPYDGGRNIRDGLWTEQYDGQRDLYEALGYTENPSYKHFKARYRRGGTAAALVDKPATDCWGERPTIEDTGEADDDDEADTPFEKAAEAFLRDATTPWGSGGTPARETTPGFDVDHSSGPMEVAQRVDRMARLGRFGLLFIGFADDPAESGEDALAEPVDVDTIGLQDGDDPEAALGDVAYLSSYDEGRVDWSVTTQDYLDDDPTSPRYGWPEHYLVELTESGELVQVHHSRVLHVVEDPMLGTELTSDSVLRRSLNRLDDLEKILGASAEAFWRSAYQGFVVSPPDNSAAGRGTGNWQDEGEQVHKQMQAYINNWERTIFSNGDITQLDADVVSPGDHVDSEYREIASGHDIPQSILMGNETGERATQEDRAMYHEFIARRRRQFCEQAILRPLINRLIAFGILPEPVGGGYDVEWPALAEMSEQEEAEVFTTMMQGFNRGTGGSPSRALSADEVRQFADMAPGLGSEVDDDGAEPATAADFDVAEDDPEVQAQFEEMQGPMPQETATDGGETE